MTPPCTATFAPFTVSSLKIWGEEAHGGVAGAENRGRGRARDLQRKCCLDSRKTWQSARKRSMALILQKWMCYVRSSTISPSPSSSTALSLGDKGGSVRDGLVDDDGYVVGDGGRLVAGVGAAGV